MAARFFVAIKLITLVIIIKVNYIRFFINMSHYVKRSKKGTYYTLGKRYSVEMYASIFKTVIEY